MRTCRIVDFAVLADLRGKFKKSKSKEIDTYIMLDSEKKKTMEMKLTVIPIVIGTFGITPKGLIKGLENMEIKGQVETIQITLILKIGQNTE